MLKIDQDSIKLAEKTKNKDEERKAGKLKTTELIIKIAIIAAFVGLFIWQPGLLGILAIIGLLVSLK